MLPNGGDLGSPKNGKQGCASWEEAQEAPQNQEQDCSTQWNSLGELPKKSGLSYLMGESWRAPKIRVVLPGTRLRHPKIRIRTVLPDGGVLGRPKNQSCVTWEEARAPKNEELSQGGASPLCVQQDLGRTNPKWIKFSFLGAVSMELQGSARGDCVWEPLPHTGEGGISSSGNSQPPLCSPTGGHQIHPEGQNQG